IPILNFMVPTAFVHDKGKLTGVTFQKVKAQYDADGRRNLVPSGEPDQTIACDDVLVAVGQENAFPWIERDCGIEFDKWNMPKVDTKTFGSTNPKVFFGGDAAFGPKNIIWAVAHGHDAALSIHKLLSGEDINERPLPEVHISSQKMGIHEWSYDIDICPMDCITFTPNGEKDDLRQRLSAPAPHHDQDLYVAEGLKTGRVMVKDEDVCLHCGLCAERCPTGAWDMQKYLIDMTYAGSTCQSKARSAA